MDYSFLSFYDTINQDLFESNATYITRYNDIHLSPNEYYLFFANIENYTYQNNNTFYFVDCSNNVLGTALVNKLPLGDNKFILEIKPSSYDFYEQEVRLRLNDNLWTNPFIYSNYRINETIRLDFKHSENLNNILYETLPSVYQGIRLKLWFDRPEITTKSNEYITSNGLRVSARSISTLEAKFIGDYITNKTYLSLCHALNCDFIYVNKIRITDKATPSLGDNYAISFNQKKIDFKVALNDNDKRNYNQSQIIGHFNSNHFNSNHFSTL